MIRCIIVDDETLAQQVIQNHLQRMPGIQLVSVCNNSTEASAALKKFEVDLIFLDIQLPGTSGMHFLRGLPNSPLVILTTAYAEYALESYEFSVIDYLLKPISFERFQKAMSKITDSRLYGQPTIERDQAPGNHIFIKSGTKFFKVNFSEIIYIEAMKDYLKIHTAGYKLVTLHTMSEMEKLLPEKQFLRVHKSFIVAVGYIVSIYGNSIELGKAIIPIGLSYKTSVMSFISRR
ncbi:MAG TPA: LytTR family DNA-binding domain-containing protein [Puia sp.]|jgi:DNA-binding LytR/AlgR family response regulator|nr:LytTR family DNA-binding domain-containing protein [Puia sp.]